MFNFPIGVLSLTISTLRNVEDRAHYMAMQVDIAKDILRVNGRVPPAVLKVPEFVDSETRKSVMGMLDSSSWYVTKLELRVLRERIALLRQKLLSDAPMSLADLSVELRVFRELLQASLQEISFYHYPDRMARSLMNFRSDWAPALAAFPSVETDALSGVDCWAMGQHVASVFHMMRALEIGLKALARRVRKPYDRQNWQNIIDQIEAAITKTQRTGRKSKSRDERLLFLSAAAKEFRYFKDGWRNYVAHGRSIYDGPQAESVVNHVRDFMNHLATQLKERVSA